MDALTFIAEIAKALAWPAASVAIALIFRAQIQTLLLRVKKGKLGPAEFEFEEGVRELQQAEQLPPAVPDASSIETPSSDRVAKEPRSVVLEAWLKVEAAINNLGKKSGHFNALAPPGSSLLAKLLQKAGVLPPELFSLYRELQQLRNQASHDLDFKPTVESVFAYVRLAQHLEAELSKAERAL
jgi:hypothetical protein